MRTRLVVAIAYRCMLLATKLSLRGAKNGSMPLRQYWADQADLIGWASRD